MATKTKSEAVQAVRALMRIAPLVAKRGTYQEQSAEWTKASRTSSMASEREANPQMHTQRSGNTCSKRGMCASSTPRSHPTTSRRWPRGARRPLRPTSGHRRDDNMALPNACEVSLAGDGSIAGGTLRQGASSLDANIGLSRTMQGGRSARRRTLDTTNVRSAKMRSKT